MAFISICYLGLNYDYFNLHYVEFALSVFFIGHNVIKNIFKEGLFSIGVIFNVFGFLYTNFLVIQSVIDNVPIDQYAYMAMELSYIGIISFNITYNLTRVKRYSSYNGSKYLNLKRFNSFLIAFFLISLASAYYVLFVKIGIFNYLFLSRAEQSLLRSDYTIFTFYNHTFPIIGAISLYLYLKYKNKINFFIFVMAFSFSMAEAIISMSRAEMLAIALPILFILNYFNIISNQTSLFFSLGGVALFGIWKSLFTENIEVQYDGEFLSWYRICRDVLKDPNTSFLYGKSYFNTLLNLVVPVTGVESLSTWYVRNYQYDVFSAGGGRGFSCVLEAYLNFHIFGVIFIYSLYGYWAKKLRATKEINIMIYMMVLVSVNMLFRSESYAFWKNMMWLKVYPILLFYHFSRNKKITQ